MHIDRTKRLGIETSYCTEVNENVLSENSFCGPFDSLEPQPRELHILRGKNDLLLSFAGRHNSDFCGVEIKQQDKITLHGSQAKCELVIYSAQSLYPFIQVLFL
jgi:hypothetical protein